MIAFDRISTFGVVAAVLFGAVACHNNRHETATQPTTVRDVTLMQIQRTSLPDYVDGVGTVRAAQMAQLSAEIVGTVREVRVTEGQHVNRGDVLVVLDDAQRRAAANQAQAAVSAAKEDAAAADADYRLAEATLNRYQSLYEKKSVSPHEFEEVQAHYKSAAARRSAVGAGQLQAQAAQEQAQVVLGYTRVRAPFDGVVTAKNIDPGALAAPGTPLLTVESTRNFRLEATVDESDLRFVKLGEQAPVSIDAIDSEVAGKVIQIVPAADATSRSFVVKVELPQDARLHSGLFGRAQFRRGVRDTIVVPGAAVVDRGQMQGVYVAGEDGIIGLRFVTVGKPVGDKVEILSGLSGGERMVVTHGGRDLAGKKVAD